MYTVADSDLQIRMGGGGGWGNSLKKQIFSGGGPLGPSPGSATAYIGGCVFSTYLGRSKGVLLNHGVRMTW